MSGSKFTTDCGIKITASKTPLDPQRALNDIYSAINTRKGGLFSSGTGSPGKDTFPERHSRWDIGFVNPALEFIARGRFFSINALNEQGQALLSLLVGPISAHEFVLQSALYEQSISGEMKHPPKFFAEESRSRQASIFSLLRTIIKMFHNPGSDDFSHFGLYGAFGYDLINQFEDLNLQLKRNDSYSDCHLFLPLEITIVDRKLESAYKLQFCIETPCGLTSNFTSGGAEMPHRSASEDLDEAIVSDHLPGEFAQKVERVIEGTKRGDYFEVVLSQSFSSSCKLSPTEIFQKLSQMNPSPYLFLINLGLEQLIGSSPEVFVRVSGNRYETRPIAGTVPRGRDALEDALRVRELISSDKDEQELTMCTDVDRNDMARVCIPGSVRVVGRRQLEFYSHLIHTVDHLEGTLAPDYDALDAFQTHMWACTVTGAPKPAALQEIENLEKSPRGWYSGAVGYLSFNGDINTGITLRTAVLKNGIATVRAGATILYGSDPEKEEQETRTKAAAFFAALNSEKGISKIHQDKTKTKLTALKKRKVILVDCRDSFVHNLASYLRELSCEVTTIRTGFNLAILDEMKPDLILLSPGPETPSHFGIPNLVGELVKKELPIFGVCLGHQGIGEHFGATLGQLPKPLHGREIKVEHANDTLFSGIDQGFSAGLYHSLYLVNETIPSCLEVIAWADKSELEFEISRLPMAIRHRSLPIAGVQFHPESLMTLKKDAGHLLIKNILDNLL